MRRQMIKKDLIIHGTKCPPRPGKIEGTEDGVRHRAERKPEVVAVRVDNKRSVVYNLKYKTSTVPVPTEMALATVRFLNGEANGD